MFENCPECGNYVEPIKGDAGVKYFPAVPLPPAFVKYKVPFACSLCGNIKIDFRAITNKLFFYPVPELGNPEKIGNIIIPESIRENKDNEWAVILTAGREAQTRKGRRFPMECYDGDLILYDKNIPTSYFTKGSDGKVYRLKWCCYVDILAIVKEEE